ncbi:hypothetical protein EEL30_00670 (plasmid) [Brevibacillus laterosporus]|uniref:Type II secretion system protein GspF domain-containing protein n=1 Tax=Brevibacillus laterosporus TaxID=1465 RepID=A0A518V1Z7_BRELA|nr:hypothetical protein EEL30_00670 [Brevibacillus laterosporus]
MLYLLIAGGVLIALLLFTVLYVLFKPKRTAYEASMLLEKIESNNTWHNHFYFVPKISGGIFKKVKRSIEREIEEAADKVTPEQVFIEQILNSAIMLFLFLILYFCFESMFFLILAIALPIYFFNEPRRKLKRKTIMIRENIRKDTPDFALTVRLLLKGGQTPVEALNIACDYGSKEGLKAYANMLKQDLLFLQPHEAMQKFSFSTQVPEMIEFSTALSQYMTVGAGKEGEAILSQLEHTFRELDKKLMEREKEVRPVKIKAMNFLIMMDGFLFITTLLALYLSTTLSKGPAF